MLAKWLHAYIVADNTSQLVSIVQLWTLSRSSAAQRATFVQSLRAALDELVASKIVGAGLQDRRSLSLLKACGTAGSVSDLRLETALRAYVARVASSTDRGFCANYSGVLVGPHRKGKKPTKSVERLFE